LEQYINEISALLPGRVLVAEAVSDKYSVDWSAENAFKPELVVRAKSVADVAARLEYCNSNQLSVVTQGG
jgi:FAD/FMN-containing dehydrogenase